jgi:hypothetical protein
MSRHCCGSSSECHQSRSRSMRRLPLPLPGCTVRSASTPRRVAAHRSGCSCRHHSRSRGRRNTQRCSLLPYRHRLHCGSSSMDRRRQSHCQHRRLLRHSGCTVMTRCTAPRVRVHPTSFPMRYRHRCHSRSRDSRSIGCRWSRRRRNCGSSCAHRRRLCRCWHRPPIRRSGYIRWSTYIPCRVPVRRCWLRHRTRR